MTDYESASIPDEGPVVSDDLTCAICDTPLQYSGRGRKPKFCSKCKPSRSSSGTSRASRSSGDVTQALSVMESMYRGLTMVLMPLSPQAAIRWQAAIADLQLSNKLILEGDKELTRSICRMGQRGGKTAFAISHVVALAPIAMTVREDITTRRRFAQVARDQAAADAAAQVGVPEGMPAAPQPGFFE